MGIRIGFDGKRAVNNMTGLGNYSRLVIESLAKLDSQNELFIYTPNLRKNSRLEKIRECSNISFHFPPQQGFKGSLWRTFGITNNLVADKVEIYHGLSNELPVNIKGHGIKSIVTIHDLIFLRFSRYYKPIDRVLYKFKYGKACKNADHIVAISERTKLDIIEFFGIPESKISVVYQGCDDSFSRILTDDKKREIKAKYNLPDKYLIQVGTIEERKNLELTVKALSAIDEDIHLVVVGKDHYGYKKKVTRIAEDTGVSKRILFLENIPFSDLPALYQLALLALYPSRYEGFGIPVLEALHSEIPVIAATGSCLEEAGGPHSLYINPDSPRELAEAIRSIDSDSELYNKIITEGKNHAEKFTNEEMALKLMNLYKSI